MANLLWGKVYFHNDFVGILREEPNQTISFTYDPDYIKSNKPKIAHSLPVQENPHISFHGLHSFFDNLVSEGWLEQAQTKLLGKRTVSRFELLLAFGFDCAGAVWVVDPEPSSLSDALLDINDPKEMATITGRASLSGVQPKLALIASSSGFKPASLNETSTHIGKFPSVGHRDLIQNEYLTMKAFASLLPNDIVAEISIGDIQGFSEPALIIKRFDRLPDKRIHFEEFNQLLGKTSKNKYEGSHKEMANFIDNIEGCLPIQNYILYKRILVGLLLGNTDMHFKNFAMFHTDAGYRLTPSYDQVSAILYQYKTVALTIADYTNAPLSNIEGKHIIKLGYEFGLSNSMIEMAVNEIQANIQKAKDIIHNSFDGYDDLKDNLIKFMDKRWNGTFSLIGKALSQKQ